MATSDILGLWNDATGNLGVKTSISALTEVSAEAAACALRYQSVVESVLRQTDWNTSRMTAALTDITDDFAAPERWAYRYEYPEDCLRIWRMESPTGFSWTYPDPILGFEVAVDNDPDASDLPTKYIYSNLTELSAIYTQYAYDAAHGDYEALFDSSLKEAIGWALAAVIAGPLTGNAQIMAQAKAEAMRTLQVAREANGNESAPNNMDNFQAESLTVRGTDLSVWPPRLINWP